MVVFSRLKRITTLCSLVFISSCGAGKEDGNNQKNNVNDETVPVRRVIIDDDQNREKDSDNKVLNKTKQRDSLAINELKFTLNALSNLKIDLEEYFVNTEDSWAGFVDLTKENVFYNLKIRARRENSSEIADWFSSKIRGGHAFGMGTKEKMPSKLNFAFRTTFSLDYNGRTYKAENIICAQSYSINNEPLWWIGSSEMHVVNFEHLESNGLKQVFVDDSDEYEELKLKVNFVIPKVRDGNILLVTYQED